MTKQRRHLLPSVATEALSRAGFWAPTKDRETEFYRQRSLCIDRLRLQVDASKTALAVEAAVWIPAFGGADATHIARAPFCLSAFIGEHGVMSCFRRSWPVADLDSLSDGLRNIALPWLDSMRTAPDVIAVLAITAEAAEPWQRAKKSSKREGKVVLFPDHLVKEPKSSAHYFAIQEMAGRAAESLGGSGFKVADSRQPNLASEMTRVRWLRLLRQRDGEVAQEVLFCNDGCGQGVSAYVSAYPWKLKDAPMIDRAAAGYLVDGRVEPRGYSCWRVTSKSDVAKFERDFRNRGVEAIEKYLEDKASMQQLGVARAAELARLEKQNADIWRELEKHRTI